jgi:hypothetical protein
MVDGITKITGAQNLPQSGSKSQGETKKTDQSASVSGFDTTDRVNVSDEAGALSDANQQAQSLRQGLENNNDFTLGQAQRLQDLLA